jgi:hypothetical protein
MSSKIFWRSADMYCGPADSSRRFSSFGKWISPLWSARAYMRLTYRRSAAEGRRTHE